MRIFFAFFFLFSASGEVLQYQVSGLQKKRFEYKEVCKELGIQHLLMVHPINTRKLDCMGTEVDVALFCEQRFGGNKEFLRSYVNKNMEEVVCELGKSVTLSIGCDKKDKKWCKQPPRSCNKLKDYYARNLELVYNSHLKKDVDDVLNCYYTVKNNPQKDLQYTNLTIKAPQDWEVELENDKVFNNLEQRKRKPKLK